MLAVLGWVLAAIALLLGAVLVVLAMPLRLRLDARLETGLSFRVRLRLSGGLVPWITVHDSESPRRKKPRERRKPAARQPQRKARRWSSRRLFRAVPELFGGVLKQFRLERLRAKVEFGLGDPAETGQLYGVLAPVVLSSRWLNLRQVETSLIPVFDRRCFSGEVDAELAVRPLGLLYPALRFAWRVFGPER